VCPVTERRSLKTEQRKPNASAGGRESGRKVKCTENGRRLFWCQSAEGFSSPDADSLRSFVERPRSAGDMISMESLILAQDERWRRA
jgi:hypothetical protein